MSKQHVHDFRMAITADPALADQVRQVIEAGGGSAGLIALARSRGFEFTQDESVEAFADCELTEVELDLVAGGIHPDGNPS